MSEKAKEPNDQVRAKPTAALESKDAHASRNSSHEQVQQAEAERTNRHSGSAGSDQNASVEIQFEDGRRVSRQNQLTGQTIIYDHVSREALMAKARDGDSNAVGLVKDMREAAKLPESAREIQLGKLQAKADSLYGRDHQAPGNGSKDLLNTNDLKAIQRNPEAPAEHRMLAKQVQDMRQQSKLLGTPTDVLDQFAGQELGKKVTSDSRLSTLPDATASMLETAGHRFGKEKVAALNIEPDDLGSALSVLLLGPDHVKSMGPEAARTFGKRLLVFVLAPAFGAAQQTQERLFGQPSDAAGHAATNALTGAALGLAMERLPALAHWVVGVTATAGLVAHETLTPESQARNSELLSIAQRVDQCGKEDLLQLSDRSRVLLGRVIYDAVFATSTTGLSIPGGAGVGAEVRASLREGAGGGPFLPPGAIIERLKSLPEDALTLLKRLFRGPELVQEGGFLEKVIYGEKLNHPEVLKGSFRLVEKADLTKLADDPRIAERLKEIEKAGEITPESAREIIDIIRASAANSSKYVHVNNLAFGVWIRDGKTILLTASSTDAELAGLINRPSSSTLPAKDAGFRSRIGDSEFRILDHVFKSSRPDDGGTLLLFTEQSPCESCDTAMLKFRELRKIKLPQAKYFFENADERLDFNKARAKE